MTLTVDSPARIVRFPQRPVVDVLIVGGGPAGLSAALVLGRARRSVMVLDTGTPANGMVEAVGGLLGQTETSPWDLRADAREQLVEHPSVEVREDAVVAAERRGERFRVTLAVGGAVTARAIVIAHGLRYDPPLLPGIDPLWGRSVFHCPFCDGWEVRDRPLAVHGNGAAAARSALVVSGWSDDVVLLTDGPADLTSERPMLEAAGVRIREERVTGLAGRNGQLQRIEFDSGPAEERDALFVRTHRQQPNDLARSLACRLGRGGTIETDVDGRTGVPGVYAAGDAATDHGRSVANAIGTGARVAQAVALDVMTQVTAARAMQAA
jgi:thioredoxin reductase